MVSIISGVFRNFPEFSGIFGISGIFGVSGIFGSFPGISGGKFGGVFYGSRL
jgi:hypothetical protein